MRLDRLLVEKGLLDSREKALRAIMAGDVLVDGQRADKAGALVSTEAEIELKGRSPFVSRGGEKLSHALEHFGKFASCSLFAFLAWSASPLSLFASLLKSVALALYALEQG
jgi:23S rRNA (cytidine1920-2'-O)/16S rRNA (cytidine1409-2'-O)-methyltransferase